MYRTSTRQALLLTTLRFLGVPANNASALSQLRRFQPPPPSYGIAANPIDAALRRELTEYFAPFQEQLRKQLAAHISCFQGAHHTKRKKTKEQKRKEKRRASATAANLRQKQRSSATQDSLNTGIVDLGHSAGLHVPLLCRHKGGEWRYERLK